MPRKRHSHDLDGQFPIPDNGKLSQRLLAVVEPFANNAQNFKSYASLVGLAIIAWNSSLVVEDMRPFIVGDFVNDMAQEEDINRPELTSIINALLSRKLELFPDDYREIHDYHLEERGDKVHLRVYGKAYKDSEE